MSADYFFENKTLNNSALQQTNNTIIWSHALCNLFE